MTTQRTRLLILPGGPSFDAVRMESLREHFEVVEGDDAAATLKAHRRVHDIVLGPHGVDSGDPILASAVQTLLTLDRDAVQNMTTVERLRWIETHLTELLRTHLDVEDFEVRLINAHTRQLELVLAVGLKPLGIGRVIFAAEEGNGICGYVAATGEAYVCADCEADPRYIEGLEGARSSLTVPLNIHTETIGVLNIESTQRAAFGEEHLARAMVIAHPLAIALHTQSLLVTERCATRRKSSETLESEIAQPLSDIEASVAQLTQRLDLDAEARSTLDAIVRSVTRARKSLASHAAGPNTLLGIEQSVRHHEEYPALASTGILVVDDDENIRSEVISVLREAGCRVDECESGGEAVARLDEIQASDGGLDVVVSDVRLPDLNGFEIFRAATERFPDVRVILMTGFGYDPHHSIVRASQEGLQSILFKPFKADQLLAEVNRAVSGS